MAETAVADRPATVKPHPKVGEVIVETRNLTKVYRDFWGRKKKVALNDLDLQIKRGEIFGLLGPIWMKGLIRQLRDEGKTVLMCSHRLDDVQDVCDRIAILFNGDLQELGEVERLVEDAVRVEVRATNLRLTDELKRDLSAVIER